MHNATMAALGSEAHDINDYPAAIYAPETGSLEVLYPDEVCPPAQRTQLKQQEHYAQTTALLYEVNSASYQRIMAAIPTRTRIDTLCAKAWFAPLQDHLSPPCHAELWQIVSDLESRGSEQLQRYCQQGGVVNHPYATLTKDKETPRLCKRLLLDQFLQTHLAPDSNPDRDEQRERRTEQMLNTLLTL